jgi:hypothetical protein
MNDDERCVGIKDATMSFFLILLVLFTTCLTGLAGLIGRAIWVVTRNEARARPGLTGGPGNWAN